MSCPFQYFICLSGRYKQLVEKGESVDINALIKDIQERDERDSKRTVSPLKPAADAILLDSTQMTIEEVLEAMLNLVKGGKPS